MYTRNLLFIALGLGLATQVVAQNQSGNLIDEILVVGSADGYLVNQSQTATRLNAGVDEIPVNLQIINKDLIEDLQLTSNRDALAFSSSVDDKRVRGFNTGEFFRNGFIHLSDTPGYLVERLEVVRGPTAVLSGPTTSGGAINVLTKTADLDASFTELNGFWGNSDYDRDNYGFNADLNFGSVLGEADYGSRGAVRLVGGIQEDTGFTTQVDNRATAFLPTLTLRPAEETYVTLEYYTYSISTDRTDRPMATELTIPGPGGTEVTLADAYGIDPRTTWFAPNTDIEESLDDISLSVKHAFNDQLFANFRYNNHQRDFVFGPGQRPRIDIFFGPVQVSGAPGSTNPADWQVRRRTEWLTLENDIDQVSADLNFLPGWGDNLTDHSFTFGLASYSQDQSLLIRRPFVDTDNDNVVDSWLLEFFDPSQINSDIATGALNFNSGGAAYELQTALDRAEKITLDNAYINYSGRFFDEALSLVVGLTKSDIELARRQPPTAAAAITENSELLLQAGAVYFFNDQVSAYVNYAESQLPDINDPDFAVARIRQAEMREIGVRTTFLDGRLGVNLGIFSIDQEISGTNFEVAESSGFDIDVFYFPTDALEVVAGYSSMDTEVTDSSTAASIGDPLVDEIPGKFTLVGKYDLGNGFAVGGGYVMTSDRPRPTAAAASAVKKDALGRVLEYEAVSRLDLFVSYAKDLDNGDSYEVSLNLRNLTEEANISSNVPPVPLQGGVDANGSPTVYEGSREVMLQVRYNFR